MRKSAISIVPLALSFAGPRSITQSGQGFLRLAAREPARHIAVKIAFALAMVLLSACSTSGSLEYRSAPREATTRIEAPPVFLASPFQASGYTADTINLFDTRVIQALRRARTETPALALTREQKVAMWVGVTIVAVYLISEWIEDEVAFFPE